MKDDKKSVKQVNPDVKPTGKYPDALESPLQQLESKEALESRLAEEEE